MPQLLAASARMSANAGTTAATKVLNAELRLLRAGTRRLGAENRLLQRRLFDTGLELLRRGVPRCAAPAASRGGVRLARPEEAKEAAQGRETREAHPARAPIAGDRALAAALHLAALPVVDLRDKAGWAATRALVADSVAGILNEAVPSYV